MRRRALGLGLALVIGWVGQPDPVLAGHLPGLRRVVPRAHSRPSLVATPIPDSLLSTPYDGSPLGRPHPGHARLKRRQHRFFIPSDSLVMIRPAGQWVAGFWHWTGTEWIWVANQWMTSSGKLGAWRWNGHEWIWMPDAVELSRAD
jgi:hypothetical protein